MYTKMLIPLDGSRTAEKVLPFARALAEKLKIPIELLGVVDVSVMVTHIAADKARYLDTLIAQGERSSRVYLKEIAERLPGLSVTCEVDRGRPAEVIIERAAADKGTLITMATHGRSGINRWLLGSVAEKVLRGTTNPLFLVRGNEEYSTDGSPAMKSIIVPLDGSELAESVLPTVVAVAKMLDLEVVLCRVYELPASAYYVAEDYLPNYDALKTQVKDEARSYLEQKIEALTAMGLAKVSSVVLEGSGAEEIIHYAQAHPDSLVAMCTHGRSGVKRWVLGSVTEKVVRHSGDPVLVVRAA
ncbi:MAG: Universal stress protein [Deltaproteobacteria bacterium]|nr:Universal stress protein [Deltaproteobacteria bacterium]